MLGWEVIPRIPLGNLSVSPHGVGIAVGYFIGATMMARRARRTGFDEDHAWNAAVVGILGAIVGARVAYVVGHSSDFSRPLEYLQIYKGGISLMGGLIGGFLAAFLYCRVKKLDFLRLADLGAAGLAFGTAIGRIGDLVIGDHLGKITSGFWGWEYKGGELISSPPCDVSVYPSPDGCIRPGMVVHQTALYDSIWALVIFGVIIRMEKNKSRPKGVLILTWAAMYSVGRILTDLTRVDKTWFGTGLTGSQLTAITALVLSLFFLIRLGKSKPAAASGSVDPDGTPVAGSEGAADEEPVVEGHTLAISATAAEPKTSAAGGQHEGVRDTRDPVAPPAGETEPEESVPDAGAAEVGVAEQPVAADITTADLTTAVPANGSADPDGETGEEQDPQADAPVEAEVVAGEPGPSGESEASAKAGDPEERQEP